MKIRPIRELKIEVNHPRLMYYRDSYNGAFASSFIVPNPTKKTSQKASMKKRQATRPSTILSAAPELKSNEFYFPERAYTKRIKISAEKYKDLNHLKTFCGAKAQEYYTKLAHWWMKKYHYTWFFPCFFRVHYWQHSKINNNDVNINFFLFQVVNLYPKNIMDE